MKHLSDYITENIYENDIVLVDSDNNIITEGFWGKLAKIFGFGKDTLKGLKVEMKDWSDDFKNNFTACQYVAATSKNKKLVKLMDEYVAQIKKGKDPLLKWFKNQADTVINRPETVKNKFVGEVYLGIIKNLDEFARKHNDKDGQKIAKKATDVIDKQNPEISKLYDEDVKKLKKVKNGPSGEDTEYSKEEKLENPKAAVIDTIEKNTDVLANLLNSLRPKVDAKKLMETVTNLLEKSKYLEGDKNDKSSKDISANVLGMSVIICGTLMMSSDKALKEICGKLGTDASSFTSAIKVDDLKINKRKQ